MDQEEEIAPRWVCPNDRELMLRAKLETGWSCKSCQFQTLNFKQEKINEQEKKIILDVLSRAQQSEELERKRISKMIERLKNMKRNVRGNGQYTCILCNESFGFFGFQAHQCEGCRKLVCNKCGVDTLNLKNETIWFCKICSETREILKKSGSWFNGPAGQKFSIDLDSVATASHADQNINDTESIQQLSARLKFNNHVLK